MGNHNFKSGSWQPVEIRIKYVLERKSVSYRHTTFLFNMLLRSRKFVKVPGVDPPKTSNHQTRNQTGHIPKHKLVIFYEKYVYLSRQYNIKMSCSIGQRLSQIYITNHKQVSISTGNRLTQPSQFREWNHSICFSSILVFFYSWDAMNLKQ